MLAVAVGRLVLGKGTAQGGGPVGTFARARRIRKPLCLQGKAVRPDVFAVATERFGVTCVPG